MKVPRSDVVRRAKMMHKKQGTYKDGQGPAAETSHRVDSPASEQAIASRGWREAVVVFRRRRRSVRVSGNGRVAAPAVADQQVSLCGVLLVSL
jgi:hypothetical protein